jgi:hypothetical protein
MGSYQTNSLSTRCDLCSVGQHQPGVGQTTCFTCTSSSYTIEEGASRCAECNNDGLLCEGGRVRVKSDYWSWSESYITISGNLTLINQRLHTVPCARGRCHGGDYDLHSSKFQPCADDRNQSLNNIMCGACRDGYTEFGSSSCVECRETYPERVFLLLLGIVGMVITLHILAQTASGLPSIFFYFGNACPKPISFLTLVPLSADPEQFRWQC